MNNIFDIEYIKRFPFVKVNKRSLMQIIIISLCVGVIGFIFETLLVYISQGVLVDRGFLCGPYLPIYSIVSFLSLIYVKTSKPSLISFVKYFLIFGVGISALEFIVGNLFELLFNVELWNYDNTLPLSYKYISGTVLLMWGLLGSISFMYIIPIAKNKIARMPHRIYPSIIIISFSVILVDLVITILMIKNNNWEYKPLYNIESSLQLTLFMIGLVLYFYAATILGKFIYRSDLFFKKIIIVIYVISIFLPSISVIDYIDRFEVSLFSSLSSVGFVVLALYLYMLMILLLLFLLIKMLNKKVKSSKLIKWSLISSILIVITGIYSINNPRIKFLSIGNGGNKIKVSLVSDVHYKTAGFDVDLNKMVRLINSTNADIVILLGDIIDAKTEDIDQEYFIDCINRLNSLAVISILGNHEYNYNTPLEIRKLYNKTKAILLVDEEYIYNDNIKFIGRDDLTNKYRKPLESFNNNDIPCIVLDHQPSKFKESVINNVLLQLSGHLHNGQLFPMNFIVRLNMLLMHDIKISAGLTKQDSTNLYITLGYGGWGFPLRTTGRSEVVCIDIFY